ncbi:MAG TPA: efflux RND transporter periplasmic adaptor subunit [Burkholderiales bacterium]|nr:efflux RND transporter periplasmic adaptor subunit [Burkholderiales bacterium]
MLSSAILVLLVVGACGCNGNAQPQAPPPAEVSVVEVQPAPVTIFDQYVAQTQAPATIEIRSQVTGLLERQAFVDGQRIARGDLLYVIDRRPFEAQVAQAKANLAQAEANSINAQQNLVRDARLLAEKFVSQQAYDNSLAQQRSATAVVAAQKALLRDAELTLGYTIIRAPRDGYISASLVKPGALITAQQTLLTTLYSSDPMWVSFSVSEDKLLELQKTLQHPPGETPGEAPPFHVWLGDGSEYNFPGRLNFVDAAIDQKSGTLQVRVSVPNPDRVLRPGLFVRVSVPAVQERSAIRIPQQAVQELQGLKSVYVVDGGNKAQPREIEARYRVGGDWVVESGLTPGERVVVEGTGKLRPGAPVRPVLMAQDGAHSSGEPSTVGRATQSPAHSASGG